MQVYVSVIFVLDDDEDTGEDTNEKQMSDNVFHIQLFYMFNNANEW